MITPEESENLADEEFFEHIRTLDPDELNDYLTHYEQLVLGDPSCTPEMAADIYSVREMIEEMKRVENSDG